MKKDTAGLTRRNFLKAGALAGGGLALYFSFSGGDKNQQTPDKQNELLPLISINSNGKITIPAIMSEMGQNVFTSLPQIVADELDADWEDVEIVHAAADEDRYGFQGTWASLSIYTAWTSHRKAGATARTMLRAAAANIWGVDIESCITKNGVVYHTGYDRSLPYGALAEQAATLPVPANVALKSPEEFHIIGKSYARRDTREKTDGSAIFGIDVKLPGLRTATLLKPPVLGAILTSLNTEKTLAIKGVSHVVEITSGVAVVADTYWLATKGVQSLEATWNTNANKDFSSARLAEDLVNNLDSPTLSLNSIAADDTLIAEEQKQIGARYELPLLAHATMEPINFTAHVRAKGCDLYGPTQDRTAAKAAAAKTLGINEEAVTVTTTFVGGGFGRKARIDFVVDAVEISKKIGAPVKVIWSREDDIKSCIFRPATAHQLSASIGKDGKPSKWRHMVAGHAAKGMDWLPTAGASHIPYKVNGFEALANVIETPVPVGTLRGIAHSSTNFANEIFVDELGEAAGTDPLKYRLAMLSHEPRAQHVLKLVAEKAGWSTRKERGVYHGIALFDKPEGESNFFIAQIAEVSKAADGTITIDRIICAADFGQPINPDGIIAQVEGGIAFGLSMALYGEITIEDGEVLQSNFHDYQVLRMPKMPKVETYVVHNNEFPRGCGEHINPATLPAVANAVSQALGQRVRKLPLPLEV